MATVALSPSCSNVRSWIIKVSLVNAIVNHLQGVDVWLEYCQFAIGGMGSGDPEQLASTRAVFEEALANQGLNCTKGMILWEVYREFETIMLAQVQAESVCLSFY